MNSYHLGNVARGMPLFVEQRVGTASGSFATRENLIHEIDFLLDEIKDRATRLKSENNTDIKQIIGKMLRIIEIRERFFDQQLFHEPAWCILLDLTLARIDAKKVSITSACIASRVPTTTALRCINQMCEKGILRRIIDNSDKRRSFIEISDEAFETMINLFADKRDRREF